MGGQVYLGWANFLPLLYEDPSQAEVILKENVAELNALITQYDPLNPVEGKLATFLAQTARWGIKPKIGTYMIAWRVCLSEYMRGTKEIVDKLIKEGVISLHPRQGWIQVVIDFLPYRVIFVPPAVATELNSYLQRLLLTVAEELSELN